MRWDARRLRLWSMDYRIQNGRCPSLALLVTSDCNLKIWRLKMIQIRPYIDSNYQRNAMARWLSIDSIDRILPYLIPNVSRGMNAKTVPITARIEQTIIKTQSKIRSRVLITSWKVFK
jgi:hypothetical protein